jgi:hypothetical protein
MGICSYAKANENPNSKKDITTTSMPNMFLLCIYQDKKSAMPKTTQSTMQGKLGMEETKSL